MALHSSQHGAGRVDRRIGRRIGSEGGEGGEGGEGAELTCDQLLHYVRDPSVRQY